MTAPETLFAVCTPGLEPALERELRALQFVPTMEKGGALFSGPSGSYEVANLWLRTATRVLLRVATVKQPNELRSVHLGTYAPKSAVWRIAASGKNTRAYERLALELWGHGTSSENSPELSLRAVDGGLELSVDTSGEPLYRRGYREEIGHAPMRETLAAGMLALAGYDGASPLWDVMCGSGTLVIEAARWAKGVAPGGARPFAFESWPSHDARRWQARARTHPTSDVAVMRGTDINSGALGIARRNARRAGVLDAIRLERADATKLPAAVDPRPTWIVANLPYGKRVGHKREADPLLKAACTSLLQVAPGANFAFLTERGAAPPTLEVARTFDLKNGGIDCTLWVGRVKSVSSAPVVP